MSEPEDENVRASKMVFIGNHTSPWARGGGERCPGSVATLLRQVCFACTTSLERHLHTPRLGPDPGHSASRYCVESKGCPLAVLAAANQESRKGTIMKEVLSDARDAGAARSRDERVGDFELHKVTLDRPLLGPVLMVITSDQWQLTARGMLDVEQRSVIAQR